MRLTLTALGRTLTLSLTCDLDDEDDPEGPAVAASSVEFGYAPAGDPIEHGLERWDRR